MRALLDTHALIWALSDDGRLSDDARQIIENRENDIVVSAVSAWEISVKVGLGKLEAPSNLNEVIERAGFSPRLIGFAECALLRDLPSLHRDPFDRMLIAQALVDGVPIVSRDQKLHQYPVTVLW